MKKKYKLSPETRRKMSEAAKQRWKKDDVMLNIDLAEKKLLKPEIQIGLFYKVFQNIRAGINFFRGKNA